MGELATIDEAGFRAGRSTRERGRKK